MSTVLNNPIDPYQIQALLSDLQSGDATQQGATQAAQQLTSAGIPSSSSWQYSTPNAAGGLSYNPLNYLPPTATPTVPSLPSPTGYPSPTIPSTTMGATQSPLQQYNALLAGPQAAPAARIMTNPANQSPGALGPYASTLGTSVPGVNRVTGAPAFAGLPANVTTPPPSPTNTTAPSQNAPRPLPTPTQAPGSTTPLQVPSNIPTSAQQLGSTAQPGTAAALAGTQGNMASLNLPGQSPYGGTFQTGTPVVPNTFTPDFTNQYFQNSNTIANNIGTEFQNAPWTSMNSATMNTGQIPQVQATLPQNFQALQTLLSGQGYTPQQLASMNAQAVDANSQAEAGTMGQARLAAAQAGLLNSGLGIGMQANIANQAGIQNQQALNQIQIANAQQAMQNMQTGAGIQAGLNTNSAQQANQVALQNAANMFSGMTQNLANQQATNAANFAGQQQKALGQAQAQSGYTGAAGQNYQTAQTGQYINANQANANIGNQQWQAGLNNVGNLANMSGPSPGSTASSTTAAASTTGTNPIGTTLQGYGANQGY